MDFVERIAAGVGAGCATSEKHHKTAHKIIQVLIRYFKFEDYTILDKL
jgi:hypothetical protein